MAYIIQETKAGNGAYSVQVADDGYTVASMGGNASRTFKHPQAAYDHYCAIHERTADHAAWNICCALEDAIKALTTQGAV